MSKPSKIDVDLSAPEPSEPLIDELLIHYGTPERTSDEVIEQCADRALDEMEDPERFDGYS